MTSRVVGYYVDLAGIRLSDGDTPTSLVHALPGGTYKHPIYGEMKFTDDRIQNFADSVTKKTRGIDPDIDYDHKRDVAKGNKAAGWVKNAEVRPSADGSKKDLHLLIEWTPEGAQSIRNKEYRYFSSEVADEWEDAQGKKHTDVLLGGGLTNRPYMKNLLPLNLSELQFSDEPQPPEKGEQVDPKELRRKLGLAETATDAEVDTRLSEWSKLADPPKKDDKDDELKKLAETNPLIKAYLAERDEIKVQLAEMQKQLALSNVTRQLSELTRSPKVQLSAAILNEARDLMLAAPMTLSEKIFNLLGNIAKGEGVTLMGERGSPRPDAPGRTDDEDSTKKLNEAVASIMEKDKVDYGTALERAVFADPDLYEAHRKQSYIKPRDV